MFNSNTLFASLIWGSIGFGMVIYGKKQGAAIPLCGGVAVMAVSYLISSALYMSLASLALIAVIFILRKWG